MCLLLRHRAEEGALKEELLGHLRAEIGVRRLLLDEDAAKLAELRVDARHLELDRAVEHLCIEGPIECENGVRGAEGCEWAGYRL